MPAMDTPPPDASAPRSHLLLGLAVVAAFSVPLALGLRYGGLDHSLVHLGMQCALRDADGLFLDAAMGGGSPLMAEAQSGVFYPITWLLWPISDAELAASLWSVVHLGIAAWSAAVLGARSGLNKHGSLALGATHALSGTVLNLILHGAYISGAAWTPLVWAGALGTFRARPLRRAPVELAVGLGMLLLAGELQGFAIAAAIALAELVRARPPRRSVGLGAVALVVGIFVGMGQWLPTFGLRDAIARSGGLSFADQTLWSLGMPEALGVVWPGVTGTRFSSGATLFHLWSGSADTRVPWNPTPYVGLSVLFLGLGVAWRAKATRWWALGATALVLMALGANTPVYGSVQTLIPPVGLFRYPAKYFAPASIALLLGAMHVLQHVALDRVVKGVVGVVLVGSGLGVVWVGLHASDLQALSDTFTFGVRTLPGVRPEPGEWLLSRGLQATAMGLVLVLVWQRTPRLAPWVLVADLILAAPFHVETLEPVLAFDAPRTHLGDPLDTVLCTDPTTTSARLDTPDRDWGLAGVTLVQRLQHKANLHQCGGPAVPQHYLSSATAPTVALWRQHLGETDTMLQAATALGCTHIATHRTVPGKAVADETPSAIAPPITDLGTRGTPPRVVEAPVLHASADDALAGALAGTTPGAVLRHLDDPSGSWTGGSLPVGSGTATFGRRGLTRLTLRKGPTGVVVFDRPWWPGWTATDGTRNLPILRAAGVRLAVVIAEPADISLEYRPPLVELGIVAGGFGWLGVMGLWWLPGRRRHNRDPVATTTRS